MFLVKQKSAPVLVPASIHNCRRIVLVLQSPVRLPPSRLRTGVPNRDPASPLGVLARKGVTMAQRAAKVNEDAVPVLWGRPQSRPPGLPVAPDDRRRRSLYGESRIQRSRHGP